MDNTEKKIRNFTNMNSGWHFGEGIPPSKKIVDFALKINKAFTNEGFPETDAFLGVGGQIQVNGYWNNHFIEVICELDMFTFSLGKNKIIEIYEDNLDINYILTKIKEWGQKWGSLEYFTKPTLIADLNDSRVYRFVAEVPKVFQSFTANALSPQEEVYVNISGSTTLPWLETQRYTLTSQKNFFQLSASS